MAVIGIDPGKNGGMAFIMGPLVYARHMPATERDIFDLLEEWHEVGGCNTLAFLEKVHAHPGQGVTSMFTFGRGYGFLRGCLTAQGLRFDDVTPQKWMKSLGCLTKGDKNVTKQKAQQLFPHIKITHATADALLIAYWGAQRDK